MPPPLMMFNVPSPPLPTLIREVVSSPPYTTLTSDSDVFPIFNIDFKTFPSLRFNDVETVMSPSA
jgi:hypothetical protein